jgi:hypothetical protein
LLSVDHAYVPLTISRLTGCVTSLTGFGRRPEGLIDDEASVRDITHTLRLCG